MRFEPSSYYGRANAMRDNGPFKCHKITRTREGANLALDPVLATIGNCFTGSNGA